MEDSAGELLSADSRTRFCPLRGSCGSGGETPGSGQRLPLWIIEE